jgi:hypothetical protein
MTREPTHGLATRLVIAMLAAAAGTAAAFVTQGQDLSAIVDSFPSIPAGQVFTGQGVGPIINAAVTGKAVDRTGYATSWVSAQTGIVDNVATIGYLVLQDSSVTPAQAWTSVDSVLVDSTDAKQYKILYRGTRRFLRVIQRPTQAATDSLWTAVRILQAGKRSR